MCTSVHVCTQGAAELSCFPPAAQEEQAEVRKGPYQGKKKKPKLGGKRCLQSPPAAKAARDGQGRGHSRAAGSPRRRGMVLPLACSPARSCKKELRFEAEGFLTRQQPLSSERWSAATVTPDGSAGR